MKRKRFFIPNVFRPLLKSEAKSLNIGVDRLVNILVERAGIIPEKYNLHLTPEIIQAYDAVLSKHYGIAFKRQQAEPDKPLTCARCQQFFKPTQHQKARNKQGFRVFCKKCFTRG